MKLWKKTMLLAFCVAMTAAISSCDILGGNSASDTGSSVEAPASESTPTTSEPDSESTSDSTSEEDVKVEYTVTFKQDGCEDIVRTVEKGKALADVPTPQGKTGYTVKWNITNFAKITKDTVVTAVATPNTYTVTYKDTDVAAATFTFDAAYELATPTKEGFKFLGWFVGEEEVPMTGTWTTANDVELTAKWQAIYTVTFVQNGYDNVVKTVLDGEALTDIPATQEKIGYTVVWETVDLSAVTGDMTVNAVETANTYTITFDMDGGTGAPATMEVTFDGAYALPAPTKTDYNFVAWLNGENSMANTGVWNIASDVTLVASWVEKDKCVITFVQDGCADVTRTIILGNDLTDIPAPQAKTGYTVVWDTTDFTAIEGNMTVTAVATPNNYTVTYVGADIAPATFTFDGAYELATPTKEGFKFLGWFVGETEMPMTGTWTTANNVELTAKWQAIYTVTFVQDGYENVVKTVLDGEALTDIPATQTKTGYTVVWEDVDLSSVKGNMTVKAVATPNKYTLTYDANGGNAIDAQEVTFDAEYTLATPTRGEYTFAGWYVMDGDVMTETKFEAGTWTIDGNVTIGAKWTIDEGVYAMKYKFNVTDAVVTQITKKAYPGGSAVSFQYYIPAGTKTGWWGIAWHTDPAMANNYHAAGIENAMGFKALPTETGAWVKVQFTLPDDGNEYYLYFGSDMGNDSNNNWLVDGNNSYALIDNFKIGNVTETFDAGMDESIFQVNVDGAVELGAGYTAPVVEEGEYSAKIIVDKLASADGLATFITKDKYPAGSTVTFRYYIPANVTSNWFHIACVEDPTNTSIYHNWLENTNYSVGVWATKTVTLDKDGYIHFAGAVGDWGAKDDPKTEGYILIDDFKITTPNGTITETFNKGLDASIFDVNSDGAIQLGDGFYEVGYEEGGEYAMKYICNASGETVSQVTKKAYAGGSTVSFQYYIPEGTVTSWWGIGWSTSNTGLRIYDAVGAGTGYELTKKTGEWVTVEFTLPEGGEYYLYFGSEVGKKHGRWMNGNENAYILIDNFKVSGEKTEDFNKPMEEWAFDVLFEGAVAYSDKDAGIANTTPDLPAIEKPVAGEWGAKILIDKISSTASTPSFITAQAYTFTEDTVVTFDYYMSGNTNNKWWTLGWAASNTNANIYAGVDASKTTETNNAKALPTNVQDAWATATVTVPAGTWYLYIAGAVGEWNGGSVIIDNFAIGGEVVEDFNDGTYGIFLDNRESRYPEAITLVDGYVAEEIEESEYAAQVYIDKIGGSDGKAAFITKDKYAAGSQVTIRYFIPKDVTSDWLAICGPTDASNTSVYENWLWNGTNYVKGVWSTITVTLKEDCYIQIGGAVGDWGNKDNPKTEGYILIDDFTVNGEVVENFNKGLENSAFNVNTPGAVVLADGYVAPSGEYSAKLDFSSSFDNNATTFITKQAYAGGSTVSFKYMIPEETTVGDWWAICWDTNAANPDFWAVGNGPVSPNGGINPNPNKVKGSNWVEYSFTLPDDDNMYYLYFTGYQNWAGYVYIDDFTVTAPSGEVAADNFNKGFDESLFNVNNAAYVTLGDGYTAPTVDPEPEQPDVPTPDPDAPATGEYAMKLLLNQDDCIRVVTKEAYAGGSTISFKYFIQADTATQWTRFIYDTESGKVNNYESPYVSFGNTAGQWVTWSYTLPEGGPYYLTFGFECGNWKDSSGAPYILIDNFTVNGAVEDFNAGVENSIFTVLHSNLAGDSADGEGYVPAPQAAKVLLNNLSTNKTTPSFITSKSYSGVATITFDCYITGNPNNKWWCLNWTADKSNASIYAFNNNDNTSETANGRGITTANQDTWQTVTIEIPEGEWYFFFGGERDAWGDGYAIIDNIVFKDADGNVIATENFDEGFTVFENNRPNSISLVEGKTE